MVFAPAVTLTVTIEEGRESHLHAGGQGFWVAQLMAELGVDVTMVAPLGGETGVVLSAIVAHAGKRKLYVQFIGPGVIGR